MSLPGKYTSTSISHLSEMLKEQEEIAISRETLRQWLRPEGFGSEGEWTSVANTEKEKTIRERSHMLFWMGLPMCGSEKTRDPSSVYRRCNRKASLRALRKEEDLEGCFAVLS